MFAHFLMRRTLFITLAITALTMAYAAAQTSSHPAKTRPAAVHHPRTHHAAPPTNAEAKAHLRVMKQEAAARKRSSRTSTEGKAALKSERNANSAQRAEAAREARARRRHTAKPHAPKKHPSAGHNVGEDRQAPERREPAEHETPYEEGFRAGFAAGLAARRQEAQSVCTSPARPAVEAGSRSVASRSAEPVPASPAQPHISEATLTTTKPVSGEGDAAGDATATPVAHPHPRPEAASLATTSGEHIAPVSLHASLHMLHEPVLAPMRGTLASLERQNRRLDAEGLQRVEDDRDLEYRIARRLLVQVPVSDGLGVNPNLPAPRRYCRPWTAAFLRDLAHMHDAAFHRPLRVDSAVRTVAYQRRLIAVNANAAPAEGDVASPHETGAAVDIAKRGMTWREIGWMRRYLTTLQNAGLIDVEEEFYQSCFHITVYDTYGRHGSLRMAGSGSDNGSDRTSDTASAADGTQGQ